MRRLSDRDWLPLLFGLVGALLVFGLAASPQSQAAERLLQTVPTPTPPTVSDPAGPPTPGRSGDSGSTPGEPGGHPGLLLSQAVRPQDVLPDEQLEFSLWLTNTSEIAHTDIVAVDALDSMLDLLEVRATQGTVRFEDGIAFIHVGALEPGQTAILILRAQVRGNARPGTIILNQFTAHWNDGQASSNIVAAGLPPDALPATGQAGRESLQNGREPLPDRRGP